MKPIITVALLLLWTLTAFAATDAVRVGGDIKVDGIHFSKDGSTMSTANGLLKNKGTWNSSALYSEGDFVQAQSGSYICLTANTNISPPNTTYWAPLGGAVGPIGPQGITGPQGPQGLLGPVGPQGPVCSPLGVVCALGEVYVQTATGIQCGTVEPYPNAIGTCVSGVCNLKCTKSLGNCDGNLLNGCETSLVNNKYHCGFCGNICTQSEKCSNGKCVPETSALLKVSIANVPTGVSISGVEFGIVLPFGVTPSLLSGSDASGSVLAGGVSTGAIVSGFYDVTTRTLQVSVVDVIQDMTGVVFSINCSIDAGTAVTVADFPLQASNVGAYGSGGALISGVTSSIEVILY
jgi:hypothetical protein